MHLTHVFLRLIDSKLKPIFFHDYTVRQASMNNLEHKTDRTIIDHRPSNFIKGIQKKKWYCTKSVCLGYLHRMLHT